MNAAYKGQEVVWMAVAVVLSALGMAVHTVQEFGYSGLVSVGTGMIPVVSVQALLFIVWWLAPSGKSILAIALTITAIFQLVGGAIISVLPLPFLPFEPEQTVDHYLSHVVLGIAQIPLVVIPLKVRKRRRVSEVGDQTIPSQLSRYSGWSAYLSAVATILGFVTIIAFFIVGQPFGTINDVSSVFIALSTLPILFALYQLHRPVAPTASLAAFVIGVIAMLVAAVFQVLLIIKVIAYAQTAVAVPVAFGLFGVSLMAYGYLARANELLPRRLALLSIIAGAGYVLVIAGFVLSGQEHPLAAIGGLTAVICYPIWAIWFGRLLLSGASLPHRSAQGVR